jgi:ABC-type transport system involved in cytochrome c biogenesis permease subunit
MRNSASLPVAGLALAVALTVVTALTATRGERIPLTELELGGVAAALALAVFGVQGLISVALEGRELRPGRVAPRLTGPLSAAIVLCSLVLFGVALALAFGIAEEWEIEVIGPLAGAGCVVLALLLVFYKEAFVGDEAAFDDRQDGVPW